MRFTEYGLRQLRERSSIPPLSLLEQIDSKKTIPIAIERKTSKVHHFFYSPSDDQCYIAVVDHENDEIITILLPEYSRAFKWSNSIELTQRARALANLQDDIKIPETKVDGLILNNRKFSVRILYSSENSNPNENNTEIESVIIKNFRCSMYGADLNSIVRNLQFWYDLSAQLLDKGIKWSSIEGLRISFDNKKFSNMIKQSSIPEVIKKDN